VAGNIENKISDETCLHLPIWSLIAFQGCLCHTNVSHFWGNRLKLGHASSLLSFSVNIVSKATR